MNALEEEYSFLAPTWRLPTVATPSMYSRTYGTSYSYNSLDSGPDWTLLNNTRYNSRYMPSTTIPRVYPRSSNQQQYYQTPGGRSTQTYHQQSYNQYGNNLNPDDGLNLTISLHPRNEHESHTNTYNYNQSNHHTINRGLTYATNGQNNSHPPPPQKRRVQIVDHNRHTPSTVANDYASDRNSRNSNNAHLYSHQNQTPDAHKFRHNQTPDRNRSQEKSQQSVSNQHHDYNDESRFNNTGNNTSIHEYLYGLGEPDQGSYVNAFKNQQRRLQDEKVGRKSVMSEYKSFAQNGGFGPSFGNAEYQSYGDKINSDKKKKTYSKVVKETNQYKIEEQKRVHPNGQQKTRTAPVPKQQRAREYAEKIEKPQYMRPVSQVDLSSAQIPNVAPIIITSLSNTSRRASLDNIQSSNLIDLFSNDYIFNRPRRSSSVTSRRHVRFRNRNFIRCRSSTALDLPSRIIGIGISSRRNSLSTSNISNEKIPRQINNFEHLKNSSNLSLQSTSYKNEKKIITSHSMMATKNMRLPPTASVVINQTYKPSLMTTSSINNNSKKSNSNKDSIPSQRPFTARPIPGPFRKTTTSSEPDFDLQIKSFHPTSSNE